MGGFRGRKRLNSVLDLLARYLSFGMNAPAPFPGYMYRTAKIQSLTMDNSKGRKHRDVSFLCKVCERGPILWSSDCYFYYRVHSSNDSRSEVVTNRLSLLRYIRSSLYFQRRSSVLMDYRYMYLRRWLKLRPDNEQPRTRHTVIRRFVLAWCCG